MKRLNWFVIFLIVTFLGTSVVVARMSSGRGARGRQSDRRDISEVSQSRGYGNLLPEWQIDPEFSHDVFTFVRIQYTSVGSSFRGGGGFGGGRGGGGIYTDGISFYRWKSGMGWGTDYPDSDLNFAFRLQQLTSIEVNPDPIAFRLTNPELFNYPFIYVVDPGYLRFNEEEVKCLRSYLLNGGFMMMDDFWGDNEWENVYTQMKRVFPELEPVELTLDHPIFNCVFVLRKKPQILNWQFAIAGRPYGITWERPDAREPHYMALYDEKGRMMAIMCHNTDTGDGWEREGEDEWFFHEFAESQAYPLGINIVFYAMTH